MGITGVLFDEIQPLRPKVAKILPALVSNKQTKSLFLDATRRKPGSRARSFWDMNTKDVVQTLAVLRRKTTWAKEHFAAAQR